MTLALSTVWEQIDQDAHADPTVDNTQTIAHFSDRWHEFIAAHLTEEDRCELVQFLHKTQSP